MSPPSLTLPNRMRKVDCSASYRARRPEFQFNIVFIDDHDIQRRKTKRYSKIKSSLPHELQSSLQAHMISHINSGGTGQQPTEINDLIRDWWTTVDIDDLVNTHQLLEDSIRGSGAAASRLGRRGGLRGASRGGALRGASRGGALRSASRGGALRGASRGGARGGLRGGPPRPSGTVLRTQGRGGLRGALRGTSNRRAGLRAGLRGERKRSRRASSDDSSDDSNEDDSNDEVGLPLSLSLSQCHSSLFRRPSTKGYRHLPLHREKKKTLLLVAKPAAEKEAEIR